MESYTFHITLYDLAFFGMICVGLTFALQLWFTKSIHRNANRLLALGLGTMVLWMMRVLAIDLRLETYIPGWDRLPMQNLLAFGPLIYLYVLKITSPKHQFTWKDLLHFSPLLLEYTVMVLEMMDSAGNNLPTYATITFRQLNPVLQVFVFISIINYLYKSHSLIEKFYRQLQPVLMDRSRLEFRWLRRLLVATAVLWSLWFACAVIDYLGYHNQLSIQFYFPFYICFGVIAIWTAAAAILKPQGGRIVQPSPNPKSSVPAELKRKGAWLKKTMEAGQYYQDPELNLPSLAEKLGLTIHELSRIINTVFKKSFSDFINEYRVRDVIIKMENPAYDHITLLGIAFDAGFNSKSTFNRIFRQMTGKSPAEYKNGLKNERPGYNPGLSPQPAAIISGDETTHKWSHQKLNRNHMLKSDFKTAWRNLKKNKLYSFLNIAGLTVGTVCAALIFLWVEDELNFNHNFSKRNYLYQVMQNQQSDAGINTSGSTPGPLAAALKTDIPGIANSGRLSWAMDELVVLGDKSIKENGMYADPSVLSMLTLVFIYGARETALNNPNEVVISETMSKKFFGNSNPVGKTITMNAKGAYSVDGLYTVTGVFKDLPANCDFHFQWLSPYITWENANTWLKPWSNNLTQTIVELSSTADPASINKKLKNYLSAKIDKAVNQCFLFSMNDWHLRNNFVNGIQDGGSIKYVRLFSMIAFIVLLIACINFMNLSTARSEQRAKEVGVLKVMGADKVSLVGKFISESVLMSFIAIILAIALLYLLMPSYNTLVQKQLSVGIFNPLHIGCLLGMGMIAGIIAGCYPAFYLSSFSPVKVLKGNKIKSSGRVVFIRKGLVVTQFVASVILIISTIVVYRQVQYIKNRDFGYNKNNLIYMDLQGRMKDHFSEIKNSLIATGYVENAATSLHDALHVYSFGDGYTWQGKNPNAKLPVHTNVVSAEYLGTMRIQLLEGRNFYPGKTDSASVIINAGMAGLMGKEGKLGSIITSGKYQLTIVGIIKDFIYNDIYANGAPLLLFNGTSSATVMAVRFKPNVNLSKALEKMSDIMQKENPGYPFEYRFADKDFDKLFSSETLIGNLAGLFAMLAVFISCLGLFGLAAYTAERRTKEIGIRKLLGASLTGLAGMLAKEFLQLVTVSCIIAFPVAWWLMHRWLQNYTYRTGIQFWMFVLAGFAALFIALVTVSFQAINTARANPVKSLRSE